eukprot:jgi/Mesvir1/12696/Mv01694-RA.1
MISKVARFFSKIRRARRKTETDVASRPVRRSSLRLSGSSESKRLRNKSEDGRDAIRYDMYKRGIRVNGYDRSKAGLGQMMKDVTPLFDGATIKGVLETGSPSGEKARYWVDDTGMLHLLVESEPKLSWVHLLVDPANIECGGGDFRGWADKTFGAYDRHATSPSKKHRATYSPVIEIPGKLRLGILFYMSARSSPITPYVYRVPSAK